MVGSMVRIVRLKRLASDLLGGGQFRQSFLPDFPRVAASVDRQIGF